MTRQEYFRKFYPVAVRVNSTVSPKLSVAVAAVESNNGNSLLATRFNNHFGIKANAGYVGGYVIMNSYENENGKNVLRQSKFRTYSNATDSYRDFEKFLQVNPRYRSAGLFATSNPYLQATALANAGYATGTDYVGKITATINQIPADLTASSSNNSNSVSWQFLPWAAALTFFIIKQ